MDDIVGKPNGRPVNVLSDNRTDTRGRIENPRPGRSRDRFRHLVLVKAVVRGPQLPPTRLVAWSSRSYRDGHDTTYRCSTARGLVQSQRPRSTDRLEHLGQSINVAHVARDAEQCPDRAHHTGPLRRPRIAETPTANGNVHVSRRTLHTLEVHAHDIECHRAMAAVRLSYGGHVGSGDYGQTAAKLLLRCSLSGAGIFNIDVWKSLAPHVVRSCMIKP